MSAFIQEDDSLDGLEANGLNISEFDARQLEYIRKLQERNRLKKQLEKKSKSKEERRKEKRERGFNLQVRGANTERVKKGAKGTGSVSAKLNTNRISINNDYYDSNNNYNNINSKNKKNSQQPPPPPLQQQRRKRKGWNMNKQKTKPKNLERKSSRNNARSPGDVLTKDAYPFGQERRSSSDSMLLQRKSSNLDNSVDYSDESFEEYDSDDNNKSDDDDDEGQRHSIKNASNNSSSNSDAVLDILKAAQQSKDGMNALRQSLVGMGKIKGITSKQQQQPHHHNSKKKKIQQQLPKKNITRVQSAKSIRHSKETPSWGGISGTETSYLVFNDNNSNSLRKSRSNKTLRPVSATYSAPPKRKSTRPYSAAVSNDRHASHNDAREIAKEIARENSSISKSTEKIKHQNHRRSKDKIKIKTTFTSVVKKQRNKAKMITSTSSSTIDKTRKHEPQHEEEETEQEQYGKDIPLNESTELTFKLLERVQCLNKDQQKHLLQMLANMDSNNTESNKIVLPVKQHTEKKHPIYNINKGDDSDTEEDEEERRKSTEPIATPSPGRPEELVNSNNNFLPNGYNFLLRAFSNWGARDVIGLTEIEIFDQSETLITIDPSWIHIRLNSDNGSTSPKAHLIRLVNGKKQTTSQSHMYLSSFQDNDEFFSGNSSKSTITNDSIPIIEFSIGFPHRIYISKILIWNYNRSVAMTSAGIRNAEVLIDGENVWSGEISKAHGNKMFNYSTPIVFIKKEKLEEEQQQQIRQDDIAVPKDIYEMHKSTNNRTSASTRERSKNEIRPLSTRNNAAEHLGNDTVGGSKTEGVEMMYEVGKENSDNSFSSQDEPNDTEDLNSIRTPLWLKKDKRKSSINLKHGKAVEPLEFSKKEKRIRETRERREDNNSVNKLESKYETNVEKHVASTNDRSNTVNISLVESSWDSLAHFERNNKSRLSMDLSHIDNNNSSTNNMVLDARPLKFSPPVPPPPPPMIEHNAISYEGKVIDSTTAGSQFENTLEEIPATLMTYAAKNKGKENAIKRVENSINHDRAPEQFEIPILPSGNTFEIVIKTTWGDPHYVGLSGIEFFDEHGAQVDFNDKSQCKYYAEPANINVLPEYNADPRTVDKLFDNNNYTCDDMHVWLAPKAEEPAKISMNFSQTKTISMIRIWNYNKSRIHSYRGAKWIQIYADKRKIFDGKIRKAAGNLNAMDNCAEVILFTFNETILSNIEIEDHMLNDEDNNKNIDHTSALLSEAWDEIRNQRPNTGDTSLSRTTRARTPTKTYEEVYKETHGQHAETTSVRPRTMAAGRKLSIGDSSNSFDNSMLDTLLEEMGETSDDPNSPKFKNEKTLKDKSRFNTKSESTYALTSPPKYFIKGEELEILFLTTWGDPHFMGLTGMEILVWEDDKGIVPFPLNLSHMEASPPDINVGGHTGDPRTLDKLVDNVCHTMNDRHMWLIPYTKGGKHSLNINLKKEMTIVGMNVWNYNKSSDDTFRGVQDCIVRIDGNLAYRHIDGPSANAVRISPFTFPGMFKFRKAPGDVNIDFKQTFYFNSYENKSIKIQNSIPLKSSTTHLSIRQDYETPINPCGHTFRIALLSTWGDPYYIGLDTIELYDVEGNKINLKEEQVNATPHSINILDPNYQITTGKTEREKVNSMVEVDTRLPSCLLNNEGENECSSCWLAPLTTSLEYSSMCPKPNYLYFTFDHPVAISMIKIFNYSKTPNRGVSSIEVAVDEILIYKGSLSKYNGVGNKFQTILFTNNDKIVEEERNNLLYCGRREQNVLCINERQVMEGGSVMQETMRGVGAYTSSKKKNGGRDQPRPKTSWKK